MRDGFGSAAALLPDGMRAAAMLQEEDVRSHAEELRLRTGFPPTLRLPEGERPFFASAVTAEALYAVLERATNASVHAVADELRQGFVSAPGGIRVGVCGTAVTDGTVRSVRDISSLCIRIPRQVRGAGREAAERVRDGSVLIVSPPGGGKTTFLRELVRTVSDDGVRVCLADERGELAGAFGGAPQFDVGRCTDVMTGAPKALAAMRMLRAMGPEVVAMDEISAPEDACAAESLLGCGVRIFATAHTAAEGSAAARPVYRSLLQSGAFQFLVRIEGRGGARRYAVDTL